MKEEEAAENDSESEDEETSLQCEQFFSKMYTPLSWPITNI